MVHAWHRPNNIEVLRIGTLGRGRTQKQTVIKKDKGKSPEGEDTDDSSSLLPEYNEDEVGKEEEQGDEFMSSIFWDEITRFSAVLEPIVM